MKTSRWKKALYTISLVPTICPLLVSVSLANDEFAKFQKDLEGDFTQQQTEQKNGFNKFQAEQKKAFLNMLESEWREFKLSSGFVRDPNPKLADIPVAAPKDKALVANTLIANVAHPTYNATPDIVPVLTRSATRQKTDRHISFNYFGNALTIDYNRNILVSMGGRPNKNNIRRFFKRLSNAHYMAVIEQFQEIKENLKLNDWGYIQLVTEASALLFNGHSNEARLFTCFILTQTGYNARVGYENQRIHLLVSTKTKLFQVPYFTFDETIYYLVDLNNEPKKINRLTSYEGKINKGFRPVDLTIYQPPLFTPNQETRTLRFKYRNKEHTITAYFDGTMANYFNSYPATELGIYFRSPVSQELNQSLLASLGKIIKGKSELEATNILLRFVQTAFAYKTDEEQFGREKYFFPEELFQHPYSDCEDRSALFSYLVRQLLNLDVVIVSYPGHIATAVRFTQDVEGDSFLYNGSKYIISDPTYINASVGMTIPQHANKPITIIPI